MLFLSDDPNSVRTSGPLYCPVPPAIRQAGGTVTPVYGKPEEATGRGKLPFGPGVPAASRNVKSGPHVAKSDAPFGVTVWGLDEWASYAYPAGGNVGPINQVVVPPDPK